MYSNQDEVPIFFYVFVCVYKAESKIEGIPTAADQIYGGLLMFTRLARVSTPIAAAGAFAFSQQSHVSASPASRSAAPTRIIRFEGTDGNVYVFMVLCYSLICLVLMHTPAALYL